MSLDDAMDALRLVDDKLLIYSLPQPFSPRKKDATIIFASPPSKMNKFKWSWALTGSIAKARKYAERAPVENRKEPDVSIREYIAKLLADKGSADKASPLKPVNPQVVAKSVRVEPAGSVPAGSMPAGSVPPATAQKRSPLQRMVGFVERNSPSKADIMDSVNRMFASFSRKQAELERKQAELERKQEEIDLRQQSQIQALSQNMDAKFAFVSEQNVATQVQLASGFSQQEIEFLEFSVEQHDELSEAHEAKRKASMERWKTMRQKHQAARSWHVDNSMHRL